MGSGGRRFVSSLVLLLVSVLSGEQASGKRWDCSAPGPCGARMFWQQNEMVR